MVSVQLASKVTSGLASLSVSRIQPLHVNTSEKREEGTNPSLKSDVKLKKKRTEAKNSDDDDFIIKVTTVKEEVDSIVVTGINFQSFKKAKV